jgi:hypothetical protein
MQLAPVGDSTPAGTQAVRWNDRSRWLSTALPGPGVFHGVPKIHLRRGSADEVNGGPSIDPGALQRRAQLPQQRLDPTIERPLRKTHHPRDIGDAHHRAVMEAYEHAILAGERGQRAPYDLPRRGGQPAGFVIESARVGAVRRRRCPLGRDVVDRDRTGARNAVRKAGQHRLEVRAGERRVEGAYDRQGLLDCPAVADDELLELDCHRSHVLGCTRRVPLAERVDALIHEQMFEDDGEIAGQRRAPLVAAQDGIVVFQQSDACRGSEILRVPTCQSPSRADTPCDAVDERKTPTEQPRDVHGRRLLRMLTQTKDTPLRTKNIAARFSG